MEKESWFEKVKMLHVNTVGLEWFDVSFKTGFWYRKEAKLENKIERSLITHNIFWFSWMSHRIV